MGKKEQGTAVDRKPINNDKPEIREQPNAKQPIEERRTPAVRKQAFRVLPTVNINVFAQVSGIKSDQLAGFYYYAKRNDIRSLTVPEWKKAYKKFLALPVK